jgi:hypothetical protein
MNQPRGGDFSGFMAGESKSTKQEGSRHSARTGNHGPFIHANVSLERSRRLAGTLVRGLALSARQGRLRRHPLQA